MNHERTYRQLHPRIVESRRARARTVFVVIGTMLAAFVFWFLVMALVFVLDTGPAILR